jgi:hypothetical protein
MLNHFFHRTVLQELTVLIAVHTIIFVLASIGICAENIVSQWHAATLTEFNNFFHISYYVYLFDAAKIHIVAGSAKNLGYSAWFWDEWTKYHENYFVESKKDCILQRGSLCF